MDPQIQNSLEQADALQASGEVADAARIYRAVLDREPKQPDANYALGLISASTGDNEEALSLFETAIEVNPAEQHFWFSFIDCLVNKRDFCRAEEALDFVGRAGASMERVSELRHKLRLAEQAPVKPKKQATSLATKRAAAAQKNRAKKRLKRGSVNGPSQERLDALIRAYRDGLFTEAEELSLAMTRDFPALQFGWKILGASLQQSNRLEESLGPLRRAIEIAPDDAEAHFNLGNTFDELGSLSEARSAYEQAIALNVSFAEAHLNLGITLAALGEISGAEESYKRAIAAKPDFATALLNLAGLLRNLDRLDEAEKSYRRVIEVDGSSVDALYNLGNLLRDQGRLGEAEEIYKSALLLAPEFSKAHSNLGCVQYLLGQIEEAEISCRKAIALDPDCAEAHSNLGLSLHALNKLDDAENSHSLAIVARPDYAEAHYNLGATLRALGRLEEAENSHTRALELKPDYPGALVARSSIRYEAGQYEGALSDLDACDTLDARARALEMLHSLGRDEEIYDRIANRRGLDDTNIRMAAFSAFISHKLQRQTAHNFCNNPLSFLNISNLAAHVEHAEDFARRLVDDLHPLGTVWQPAKKATVNGLQMRPDVVLFDQESQFIQKLKTIIYQEIASYREKFNDELCAFIQHWPADSTLAGWHVILKRQGYQSPHIHPAGWISGVVYLRIVPSLGKDEGAIEFGLNGSLYSDPNSPSVLHQPKVGDIALFPSSLHHRTIPFTTESDRIVIAFDLMPNFKMKQP